MSKINIGPEAVAIGVGVLVVGYLVYKGGKAAYAVAGQAVDAAGGVISGNNAVTQNATDANGNPVSAYQGAGVVGSIGAATNVASGGWFASAGSWIGTTAYDLTH